VYYFKFDKILKYKKRCHCLLNHHKVIVQHWSIYGVREIKYCRIDFLILLWVYRIENDLNKNHILVQRDEQGDFQTI